MPRLKTCSETRRLSTSSSVGATGFARPSSASSSSCTTDGLCFIRLNHSAFRFACKFLTISSRGASGCCRGNPMHFISVSRLECTFRFHVLERLNTIPTC